MTKRRSAPLLLQGLLLFFLLFWPTVSISADALITQFQIRSFAEQCLQRLEKGRSEDLIRLYHYPAEMSPAELESEKMQIAASLAELGRLFGAVQQSSIPDQPRHLHQFEVQSASSAYWAERSRYYQVVYNITFSELGDGALVFRMVVYDHRLQLRSISYALSADGAGADQKKAEINSHMTRFFLQLQGQAKE